MIQVWLDMFRDGDIFVGVFVTIIGLFVIAIVLVLGLLAFNWCAGHDERIQVAVISKLYSPEHNSIGSGVGVMGNGKVGMVITSQHESEKFILIVKDSSGECFSCKVNATTYVNAKENDIITITIRIGKINNKRID
jgi:hypothetical protein